MKTVADRIAELKILPVISLEREEDAAGLAAALTAGGVPAAEITFRTGCAAQAIRIMRESFPEMLVGAGTVLNPEQADAAIAAGAQFIVAPGFDPATVRHCLDRGIPVFPGCATASEVQQALDLGLNVLKFFPAEQCGGVGTLKALSAPFGQVRWMPTGGIGLHNLKSYLDFPKVLACGGSFLAAKEDIRAKDWEKIAAKCRETVRLIRGVPAEPAARSTPPEQGKRSYDIIALGEVLMRLSALPNRRIGDSPSFAACIGGSELNVCSGLAGLGASAGILTCLPDNEVGRHALREIRRMGVGEKLVSFDAGQNARLGLYYSEEGAEPRKTKVVYDRSGSSFYRLSLDRLPPETYSSTRLFHTTGITLALAGARELSLEAIRRFKAGGAAVSFDVNYRANLWDEETALGVLRQVLPLVDVLFVSEETSRRMFRKTGTLREIMRSYSEEYGVKIVATTSRKILEGKKQSFGSTVYSAKKDEFFTGLPYESIAAVDRIGSGDAYDAGVLYALLEKGEEEMPAYGDAMAALKCTVPGDLPDADRAEVEALIAAHKNGDLSEMSR